MAGKLTQFLRANAQKIRALHNTTYMFTTSSETSVKTEKTFEELLESSPLMKVRRPQGLAVRGKITNVCNDDLYVDFGGKFEVVVKRPDIQSEKYTVGAAVRIMLKKLEMTGHFLGQSKHLTLLEAEGRLMGLDHNQNTQI